MRPQVAIVLAAVAMALAVPSSAPADVLIDPPKKRMTDLGCMVLGVWYQSYSGGPRTISVTVRHRGRRRTHKHIRATTQWRDHVLHCPGYGNTGRWTVRVSGAGWSKTYRVRVYRGGD